jgi:hypothetical protein
MPDLARAKEFLEQVIASSSSGSPTVLMPDSWRTPGWPPAFENFEILD